MYDELIGDLYLVASGVQSKNRRELLEKAANAIKELSREAEEYKAAYRKEHNKRIAENRYLYDELTKAARANLLMTPMRIEVPESAEEGE